MEEILLYTAQAPFESARRLDAPLPGCVAPGLHGHSFLARVRARLPSGWSGFPGDECGALEKSLAHTVAPLDYSLLNDHLEIPTNANLARWIDGRLDVPGVVRVGVRGARHGGADYDRDGSTHAWRRVRFEAAHRLPKVPPGHQCGRMHGHGFDVVLRTRRLPGEHDSMAGEAALDRGWAALFGELDHNCLNDIPGLENPTSEMIATWIWGRLKPQVPSLSRVTVYETVTAGCHFDGTHYRIWKERRFESALRLSAAPPGDHRRRLHGHSYRVRLYLTAGLDPVLGWTVDYGDVKVLFRPVYHLLDHRRLDEIDHIDSPDPAAIAIWLFDRLGTVIPHLDRIDLYQTPGCGVILDRSTNVG
ncbi:MAG: 6-carboxytetrahydropterin synthase [Pseudomonadota bacterium]|nr:6-carboxytetrahydropterin synthase [Pseudomonadota bacterium]